MMRRGTVTVDMQMKLVNNNKEAIRDMGSCAGGWNRRGQW